MSLPKPIFVVLGATGTQGGSIIAHFLSLFPSTYTLRGVTRDTSSPKARQLASLGVELVTANFDDPSSLDAAFHDASVIFSNTDFWQIYADPSIHAQAAQAGQSAMLITRDKEIQQSKNVIDAAAKVRGLQRFILSSLPHTEELSGGKYTHVHHFNSKAMAEEYGRTTYPGLWAKTSVLYAGYYLENYFAPTGGVFRPKLNSARDTLIMSIADPLGAMPLPMYSAANDTGALVHALLRAEPGKKLVGVNEWLNYRDFARQLADVLGKKIEFVDQNPSFDLGNPDLEQDYGDMMGWYVEFGYDGARVDSTVIKPQDLGVEIKLKPVKDWLAKQEWESVLETVG